MSKTKPIILFLTMALAGCATPYSETPTASNFPTTSQEKLQAAAHWGLITQDLSQKLQTQMSGKVSKQQPLYVSATDDTPFNQAAVGELSALATGLWALTELNASITPAGVATGVIFAGDAQAYFNSDKASGPTPQTEIIINATVSDNSRYLAVSRATYYAADRDHMSTDAVFVNLKVIQPTNNVVLAVHDYAFPMDSNLRTMTRNIRK